MNKVISDALENEKLRQQNNIELIASENYVSKSVLELQGSILTNKYAEGYPGKRYYGGCENVDIIETETIELAKKLFGIKYANVQPHSGSSANMAVYRALLNEGDKVLGMNLSHGGHLTHGHKLSFSGQDYDIISYDLDENDLIDYDEIERIAEREHPKMIIAGASAYSRLIDYKRFREISQKVGAYLMVDMAHIAGLVATKKIPNPCEYADIVTSTTHKTLRGPRGGFILTNNEEIAKKIDKTVFPGIQGGPLMHIIAAKGECFYEASLPEFQNYINNVMENIKALSDELVRLGYKIISSGTDTHLILVDVKTSVDLTGKEVENILSKINITVNKNSIPNDTLSPMITSGIRIGSPAMTSRGLNKDDFILIARLIDKALKNYQNELILESIRKEVLDLTNKYPIM